MFKLNLRQLKVQGSSCENKATCQIPFYFKKSFYHAYRSKHTGGEYCYGFKLHIFLHVLFCSIYMIYMYWAFFRLCSRGPVKLSYICDLWVFACSSQICGHLQAPAACGHPQCLGFMLCHSFARCGVYLVGRK